MNEMQIRQYTPHGSFIKAFFKFCLFFFLLLGLSFIDFEHLPDVLTSADWSLV